MKNLQELLDSKRSVVEYFYNDTISQFHRMRTTLFAKEDLIPVEYTNWRDEQRAGRQTCILANQSHHMPVLTVKGPDARRMLEFLTPCSFSNLSTDRAKQYFACTPRGHHIGDCILHYHGEEQGFELISGMPLLNWVRFHGESGEFNVSMKFDAATPYNLGQREKFRFQIEGPSASKLLEEVTGGHWPEIRFFHTAKVVIAGCEVLALRHGMGNAGGAEISGPYANIETVRDAILRVGEKYGLHQTGTATYFSNGIVSGWVPYPLPGIYTGEELRAYREWLPADGWEANMQLGGSLYSENIEDYYWTPSALGYDRFVKFDHDFIGREALEAQRARPRRVKRILRWSAADVTRICESQFSDGLAFKAIELPTPMYGWPQADEVRSTDGALIGMSQFCGYTANEKDLISLCCIDESHAGVGTEVVLVWGEANGGSRKPHVEKHAQTTIRATICEAPYAATDRSGIDAGG